MTYQDILAGLFTLFMTSMVMGAGFGAGFAIFN